MNRTLQARQNQSKLFQQQENANLLYTVNWAGELDTDIISTSTWVAENNAVIVPVPISELFGGVLAAVNLGSTIRILHDVFTVIPVGVYITFDNLTGDSSMIDFLSTRANKVVESGLGSFQVETLGNTGTILSGDVLLLNNNSLTKAYISGTPGKYIATNKITTVEGNTMERQLIIKVLDNDMGIASDYC